MKTVNVIISTFNGENFIKDQLDSIFNQEGVDIKITIRDDGSSDSTVQVIKQYLEETKRSLNLIVGENVGIIKSFWLLLEHESNNQAEFLAFCDQDDIWEPKKLYSAIMALGSSKKEQPKLYYSSKKISDQKLKIIGFEKSIKHKALHNILVENYATGCTVVINQPLRKSVITSSKNSCIMHDWWILLAAYACGSIIVADESAHIIYRQHGNNAIGSKYSPNYWLKKVSRMRTERNGRIFTQARAFKNSFYQDLNDADKAILTKFICSENSFTERLRLIFSCKGFKSSPSGKVLFSIKYLAGLSG